MDRQTQFKICTNNQSCFSLIFGGINLIKCVQSKELDFFVFINVSFVFRQGGHVSGFRGVHNHDTYHPNEPVMFHVKGDKPDQTRAIQVGTDKGSTSTNNIIFALSVMQVHFHTSICVCVWGGQTVVVIFRILLFSNTSTFEGAGKSSNCFGLGNCCWTLRTLYILPPSTFGLISPHNNHEKKYS